MMTAKRLAADVRPLMEDKANLERKIVDLERRLRLFDVERKQLMEELQRMGLMVATLQDEKKSILSKLWKRNVNLWTLRFRRMSFQ